MATRNPIGRHIPYPAREMYYPAWAPSFEGLDELELKWSDGEAIYKGDPDEDGNPVPVMLRDVAPERRWAVDFDTGHLISQRDFSELYELWITNICKPDGQVEELAKGNKYFNPASEEIPNIEDFVLRQPDGTRAHWKKLRVADFKPPSQAQNEGLIAQLVEGLGGAMSGFAQNQRDNAVASVSETRQVAEVRPKFAKVPAPSQGDA